MAEVGKNFRTAYYESLGFKEGEKQQIQLESLLKADVIGKETMALNKLIQALLSFQTSKN